MDPEESNANAAATPAGKGVDFFIQTKLANSWLYEKTVPRRKIRFIFGFFILYLLKSDEV